jgi:hypothetical protein
MSDIFHLWVIFLGTFVGLLPTSVWRCSTTIAVTIGFTSLATSWIDYVAIIAGIVAMASLTYVSLRLSSRGMKLIGPVGVNAMTEVMGFLTMCIGVQFVVNGVLDPDLRCRLRAPSAPPELRVQDGGRDS